MIEEELFQDLKILKENELISKNELILLLKNHTKHVSVYDLIHSATLIRQSMEYVQEEYQEVFAEPYIKTFILGFNELKNQQANIDGYIDKNLFIESIENLEYNLEVNKKKYNFSLIIALSSLYVTFIKKEPLHPVGSIFPGSFKVYEENGIFYCPVKDAQKDNPNALCIFCLAEQTPNVH